MQNKSLFYAKIKEISVTKMNDFFFPLTQVVQIEVIQDGESEDLGSNLTSACLHLFTSGEVTSLL